MERYCETHKNEEQEVEIEAANKKGLTQQKLVVDYGYWPLIRYNPELRTTGKNPFVLDSPRPTIQLKDYGFFSRNENKTR